MKRKTLMTIGLSLLFFAALLATAEPQAALAGKPQRLLLQVPPRTTGLDYRDKGLRSSPNTTRRNYFVSRGKAAQIRTLGAGTNSTQIARAACNTTNVMDPQCTEVLLLALTPPSYSSNNTRDTTLRRAFISPAQDQGECASCVGFAVTAAAEAAINVYQQQSWRSLGLSEQDLSFCMLFPRVDCAFGATYSDVIDSFVRAPVSSWAARSCYLYTGSADGDCARASACANQLPPGVSLSWAYDANALNTMAKVKERIMLSGGVIASMAMSPDVFEQFKAYGADKARAVFAPRDDLEGALATMHAIFCYGWWDNPRNNVDGWWLCKNSWGPSWGLAGSFRIAYGAAYIMQQDYTFALEVKEDVSRVLRRFRQAAVNPTNAGCLQYSPRQPVRLLQLASDLRTLNSLNGTGALPLSQVLADVVASNVGRVSDLSAASRGPFRFCGTYLGPLMRTACLITLPQPQDALPWGECRALVGSVCNARCIETAKGRGYRAVCTLSGSTATWQVTGGCPSAVRGSIILQAAPTLCVGTPSLVDPGQQVVLQTCGGALSSNQQFEYKEGRIVIQATAARTEWCLGVSGVANTLEFNAVQVKTSVCDGSANQRWLRDADGALRPLHALQNCVDVIQSNFTAGERVQLWRDCNRGGAQRFWADFVPYIEGRAGIITLQANTSLCVAAPVLAIGAQVELQPCSSSGSAHFIYPTDGSLRWEETSLCLEVFQTDAEKSLGAAVGVAACNGKSNQRWWKDADGALQPMHSLREQLCLDVPSSNFRIGAKLQLWKCNQGKAQLFAAELIPSLPATAYLGCFHKPVESALQQEQQQQQQQQQGLMAAGAVQDYSAVQPATYQHYVGNISTVGKAAAAAAAIASSSATEQCWQWAASNNLKLFGLRLRSSTNSLFCYPSYNISASTALGPALDSACAAEQPDVWALHAVVPPGGPIPRGCVTDEAAFLRGHPAEEYFGNEVAANYATARAFARMKGAKYFAVARAGETGHGFTFDAEPTTAPVLNITVNGSLGCYAPCADDASRPCGSGDGFGGATVPRVWFVYEFPS